MKIATIASAIVVASLVLLPGRAQANLDPGSGSFLLQAAIAVLLAGAVTLKQYWHRFRSLFRQASRPQDDLDLDD